MTPKELSRRLASKAEEVAKFLLPNGSRKASEWKAGSTGNTEGDSLGVHLTGEKAGVWCDFATHEKGDLLDLWMAVRGCTLPDAMEQAGQFVGVRIERKEKKTYKRPVRPEGMKSSGDPIKWLIEERKISPEAVKAYKVAVKGDCVVFPHIRDGELCNYKLRSIKDKKAMMTAAGCEQMLWGWQAIDPNARSIVICEGEIDALTLWDYGFPALSVFSGANNLAWLDNEYEQLQRFDDIYLCFDSDEAGKQGMASLLERLGRDRCLIVTLPHKDANECRKAGVDRAVITACFDNAEHLTPNSIRSGADFCDELLTSFYPATDDPIGVLMPWPSTYTKIALRPSELSVWTGFSGHKKSMMLGQVMLGLAEQGERVCIASLEMRPRATLKRMVKQAMAKERPSSDEIRQFSKWLKDRIWVFDFVGQVQAKTLLDTFSYMRKRYGVSQFVIDNLMMLDVSAEDKDSQTETVRRLLEFKSEYDCHLHLVAHARKAHDETKPPRKLDVSGSANIVNQADNVFSVWWNKSKNENGGDGPDATLVCDKQRNGEWEGTIPLSFDSHSLQFVDNGMFPKPLRIVNHVESDSDLVEL